MKVAKFGGSSVSNAKQIKKVLDIVNGDPERKIIIVSAPGKRSNDDTKTTDLLIRLYEKVLNGLDYQNKKKEIIQIGQIIGYDMRSFFVFRTGLNIPNGSTFKVFRWAS